MSIDILSVYDDVVKDTANADQNGHLSYEKFSRLSRRAELSLIDWLSGGVTNERMPIPWQSQKNKDWLSSFITKFPAQVANGFITRPADYYQFENIYRLGPVLNQDCDDEEQEYNETSDCNTSIKLLDGQAFNQRCQTNIEELKPTVDNPVSKMVGKTFEFAPKDLGPVTLEYIRRPVFGSITSKTDPTFNDDVPDVVVNYEWDEFAREFLVWFICDAFANNTREQALKAFNQASNPKP